MDAVHDRPVHFCCLPVNSHDVSRGLGRVAGAYEFQPLQHFPLLAFHFPALISAVVYGIHTSLYLAGSTGNPSPVNNP